jgi:hypothetical protein
MKKKTTLLAAFALAALAACEGDALDVGSFSVDGTWTGNAEFIVAGTPVDTARYTFVLDLDQAGRDVSGSGEVQTEARTLAVEVDGRWDYPRVDLVLSASGFAALVFNASFATPDSLKGTLAGSGFNGTTLNLVRQRSLTASRAP